MSYIVFARKWRPNNFDEIIAQAHITTTLKNAIRDNRVAHAYIFTGPRGIGKTSAARIFAKGLNCEKGPTPAPCGKCISCAGISSGTSMDVIEIDGASNNSVDQVRELRENIKFSPSYGRHKIYIIDEVHMLSLGAFNALLKTLEEPPGHAKFIFATTNPEKVPATILSRCQRFDFRRIPIKSIISKLKDIAAAEKLNISEEALFSIATSSDGSMRDAESILDQLASFCDKKISREDITALLGTIEEDKLTDIMGRLFAKDAAGILRSIDELIISGKDISQFIKGLMGYVRNLMVLKVSPELDSLLDLTESHIEKLKGQIGNFRIEELLYIFYTLSAAAGSLKRSDVPRFIVEASFIKLCRRAEMMSLPEIADKIDRLKSGVVEAASGSASDNRGPAASARRHSGPPAEEKAADYKTAGRPAQDGPASPPRDNNNDNEVVPAAPAGEVTSDEVLRAWPRILEIIKGKRISIASYLIEGRVAKVQGLVITLSFSKKFNLHKEVLEEANNKRLVEDTYSEVLGRRVKLAFITSEEPGPSSMPSGGFAELETQEEYPAEENDFNDPIIRSAVKIFGGKIVKGERGGARRDG